MKKRYSFAQPLRLLLLSFLLGLFAAPARAQVTDYVFAQRTATYVPITGTLIAAPSPGLPPGPGHALDGQVYQLPAGTIPFPFVFNGVAYTGCYVASSGYLTFGAVAPHDRYTYDYFTRLPYIYYNPLSATDSTNFDGAISALGGVLLGSSTPATLSNLRYQTLGAAPARTFVVQWSNINYFTGGGLFNFQIRLHETSNEVELAYGPSQPSSNFTAQVGLRGFTPADFQNRTGTWPASTAGTVNTASLPLNTNSRPANGLVFSYTPPAPLPCARPHTLTADPLGNGTQATLRWRTNGPSPGPYTVEYGPVGFAPGTGTLRTATGLSLALTGLAPFTEYEFYVTQTCGGAAGSSPRSALPGRFRTTLANDDPVGATPLPIAATCQPVAGTTAGATLTLAPGYQNFTCQGIAASYTLFDVWYSFTTAASGPASTGVRLSATGGGAARARVYSSAGGAAGPFTLLRCEEAMPGGLPQPFPAFILGALTPSTTYYVAVANSIYLRDPGAFTICATVPPPCSPPTGVSSDVLVNTATTAVLNFTPGSGALDYTLELIPPGGTPFTISPNPTTSPVLLTGLTPATTYAATLRGNCAGGVQGAPVSVSIRTRPTNDDIQDAQPLPITATCQPVSGSTENSVREFYLNNISTGCGQFPGGVWYTFTTPATGPAATAVRITTTGLPAGRVYVFSTPGPTGPFTHLRCVSGTTTSTAPAVDVMNLAPSSTYHVLVSYLGFPAVTGPFTICVTEPPSCGDPFALGITSITPTSANLSFIAGSPAPTSAPYTLTVTPQGGAAATFTSSGASGVIPLTSLLPGTYYTVTLQANCGPGSTSRAVPISFRTLGPPANDLCADAIPLACGQTLPGTTVGATATGDPSGPCGLSTIVAGGVWYRTTGTGQDFTATNDFQGGPNQFTRRLHVFSGSCAALSCVGGYGGFLTLSGGTVTFPTVAGMDYFFFVSGGTQFPPLAGEFEVRLSCATAGTCPTPTNVVVSVTGPTSASVSFTPVAGATRYYATWRETVSGQLTLSSVTAPPASIISLARNTAYTVEVRADCGGVSSPVRSYPFTTVLAVRGAALAAQVALFPNPAHASATLMLPANLTRWAVAVTLHNALGQVAREYPAISSAAPAVLDLRGLAAGVYTVRLLTEQGPVSKRLLVE